MNGEFMLGALAFEMLIEFITHEFTSTVKTSVGGWSSSMVKYPCFILFIQVEGFAFLC